MAYSKRFDDALLYAVEVHRDQVRKGPTIPYVTHLLSVAFIVGESGGSQDEVIAALLHDADARYGGLRCCLTGGAPLLLKVPYPLHPDPTNPTRRARSPVPMRSLRSLAASGLSNLSDNPTLLSDERDGLSSGL